jgi:hypothetical protein
MIKDDRLRLLSALGHVVEVLMAHAEEEGGEL